MKLLISILIMMTAATAQARTSVRNVESFLKIQHMDSHSPLAVYGIQTAHIFYDASEKTLTLTLEPAMPLCDINLACIALMPAPIVIEMDEANATSGACGNTVYTATIDGTPYDGLLETLSLTDNSNNVCNYARPISLYEVSYKTMSPWTQEESMANFVSLQPDYHTMDKSILPIQPEIELMNKQILPVDPEVQTLDKAILPVPPVEM